jgi:hypothetical protein
MSMAERLWRDTEYRKYKATFHGITFHATPAGASQQPVSAHPALPGALLSGAQVQAVYRDRWPVEGLPLWAKQMLGAAQQFVFALTSQQRLPELSLLAGSILAYTAATQPALPTGFWDRAPRPTPGRLRRVLAQVHFDD